MRSRIPALWLLLLLVAAGAKAETVVVTGADGAAGANGEDALASTSVPGEDHDVAATGGAGGASTGADAGGAGGSATAEAAGSSANLVEATATGGAGGGAEDGAGGDGGDATASVRPLAFSDRVTTAVAEALGGAGGISLNGTDGLAGDATALAEARNVSTGDATASASAISPGGGAVRAHALADARGFDANSAGSASADAYGSNDGPGDVHVTAEAITNGATADYGPTATAEGVSTGGGDVTVEALLNNRGGPFTDGTSELHDAVRGSTSGTLTLRQYLNWPLVEPVYAENVATSLTATNPGGGDLVLDVVAISGGTGGTATLGDVVGTSDTGADVSVRAGAAGTFIEHERVHAESNGGAVSASLSLGAYGRMPGELDGTSIEMVDLVTAESTGAITLEQSAGGGHGGRDFFSDAVGSGGDATSVLTRTAASEALSLVGSARGGIAAVSQEGESRGGNARVVLTAENTEGSANAEAHAVGGRTGTLGGGEARVEIEATSHGDGNAVTIGRELHPSTARAPNNGAVGGEGSMLAIFPLISVVTTNGGDAHSHSVGTALGDSVVTVYDSAVGGRTPNRTVGSGQGGNGGNAFSVAEGVGAGVSSVFAKSEARGGSAGEGFSDPGRDGDADARAHATGFGEATAWALARTDWPFSRTTPQPAAGLASARATADGTSGSARAEAVAGRIGQLRAQSEALVASRRETAAFVTRGVALADMPSAPDLHGASLLVGDPFADDVDAARAGNAALDTLFEGDASATALALGNWHGLGDGDGPLLLSSELQIAFDEDQASRGLFLAAFDTSVVGDGFGGLDFTLEKNGLLLDTWSFETTADLLAFFADALFELGAGWFDDDVLVARFDLEVTGETRVGMGFAFVQAIPEPGTAMLLAFGLLLLARRRRA